MPTLLEIVDSAVKIGLGALITAAAAYWTGVAKNRHELRKSVLDERRLLIRSAATEVTKSLDCLDDYIHLTHVTNWKSLEEKLSEHANLLIEAHKAMSRTQALVALVGSSELSAEVAAMRVIVEEIHRTHASISVQGSYSNTLSVQLTTRLQDQTSLVYAAMASAYRDADA